MTTRSPAKFCITSYIRGLIKRVDKFDPGSSNVRSPCQAKPRTRVKMDCVNSYSVNTLQIRFMFFRIRVLWATYHGYHGLQKKWFMASGSFIRVHLRLQHFCWTSPRWGAKPPPPPLWFCAHSSWRTGNFAVKLAIRLRAAISHLVSKN